MGPMPNVTGGAAGPATSGSGLNAGAIGFDEGDFIVNFGGSQSVGGVPTWMVIAGIVVALVIWKKL